MKRPKNPNFLFNLYKNDTFQLRDKETTILNILGTEILE